MDRDFPNDENGEVLRRMQRNGDDFTKPRNIDFSVIFPSEICAEEFMTHFDKSGYKLSLSQLGADRELPWDVTVTHYMLPDHGDITDLEEELDIIAAPLGGRNDGWGCFNQPVQH